MSKINTRAPYHLYYTNNNLAYTLVSIAVYTGKTTDFPATFPINLRSTAINNATTIEISEIIRGYIDDVFNGDYTINPPWARVDIEHFDSSDTSLASSSTIYSVFEGFPYFEMGSNVELNKVIMTSNDSIVTNDGNAMNIPVYAKGYDVTLDFYNKDNVEYTKTVSFVDDSSEVVQYVSNSVGDIDMFESRVSLDGGVTEAKECVNEVYEDYYSTMDIDKIIVSYNGQEEVIPVKEIEECKFETYKLTFKNLYGVWQDLWFFKRTNKALSTKNEEYKSNVITNGAHNTSRHQYTQFNKNGREVLTLNTGFYPESYNDVFKELQLSEQVYIEYNKQTLPVNINGGAFAYKTNLNDKVINYTIEVQFAFDSINSVR